jgi:hypothetical protein
MDSCPNLYENPYGSSNTIMSCRGKSLIFIPSIRDLEKYCTHQWYNFCPLYLFSPNGAKAQKVRKEPPRQATRS